MSTNAQLVIRPERAGDEAAIRQILDDAFAGPVEGELVERLALRSEVWP